jgi:hypothetical protein
MLATISDRLFMIGLLITIAGVVIAGVGPQLLFPMRRLDKPDEYETKNGKERSLERQDLALNRLKKSLLLWIGLGCMVISIILSVI